MKKVKKDMENIGRIKIWTIFIILLVVVSVVVGVIVAIWNFFFGALVSGIFFLSALGYTLVKGYVQTPNSYEDIVETMGEYIRKPLEAGPHFLFPFFELERIKQRVFMGEQRLELYLDEKNEKGGDLEFQDCSASLKSFFFFVIYDPKKAVYDIDDLIGSIEEKADHILRAFFGVYPLEEAISMKSLFRLPNIAMLMDFSSGSPHKATHEDLKKTFTEDELKNCEFYKTLDSWGVIPKSFSVSDIEVPDTIKVERERVLKAEKDLEVAGIDIETAKKKAEKDFEVSIIEIKTADKKAKKVIIEATASSKKTALEGKGESEKLRAIVNDGGIDKKDVTGYLVGLAKWEAIGKNPNVTIIEDSGNGASSGARFGAGFNASNKPQRQNPNPNSNPNSNPNPTPKTK